MTTISTRIASPADLDVVASLFDAYRQFYQQPADLALATRFMTERMGKQESVVIVAQGPERTVLGFCQLYPTFCSVQAAPILTLYDLFVRPEARGAGAGKQLMLAAERYAADHGFARMDLSTAKTNLPAQALYESLGWVRDGTFHTYSKAIAG